MKKMEEDLKVKWVKRKEDGDEFYIRKYRKHWWQFWKTTMMYSDRDIIARYDCISGFMYQRVKENYYKK